MIKNAQNISVWKVTVQCEIKYTAKKPALVDESQFDVLMRLPEEKQEDFFFDTIATGTVARFETTYCWNLAIDGLEPNATVGEAVISTENGGHVIDKMGKNIILWNSFKAKRDRIKLLKDEAKDKVYEEATQRAQDDFDAR